MRLDTRTIEQSKNIMGGMRTPRRPNDFDLIKLREAHAILIDLMRGLYPATPEYRSTEFAADACGRRQSIGPAILTFGEPVTVRGDRAKQRVG